MRGGDYPGLPGGPTVLTSTLTSRGRRVVGGRRGAGASRGQGNVAVNQGMQAAFARGKE